MSQGDRRLPPTGATIDQLIARSMGGIEGRQFEIYIILVVQRKVQVISNLKLGNIEIKKKPKKN